VLEACENPPAAPGELVACAGAGRASHAEVVCVPRHLCARVPDGVAPEDAAYTTVAAIALHGVRLAGVGLGDVVAVVGLGLVGQLTLQLLRAGGSVALGIDPDPSRGELARASGFFATTDAAVLDAETRRRTAGRGADGVLVTAASQSAAALATATGVARERAVIAIVGDVAIESDRAPLFSKELRLVVSRSYGPGRYDPVYEERGIDYPAGYVRWTEGRNLEEVLRLMSTGQLRPSTLTTHTLGIEDGPRAYELLGGEQRPLGILLRYAETNGVGARTIELAAPRTHRNGTRGSLRIGVLGAGTFARSVLLPGLAKYATITAVAAGTGPSARSTAERYGAALATTDANALIGSDDVDAVVIATRHHLHARYAIDALRAGKHVFVEKPLALAETELRELEDIAAQSPGVLFVGFNRRFAPLAAALRDALCGRGPVVVSYRVNAGRLPDSHWTHDPDEGGGRIVGEVCHFVDFASYLCEGEPRLAAAAALSGSSEPLEDDITATIRFPDGSLATIVYCALGDQSLSKERVELFSELGAGVLDDFSSLTLHRGGQREHQRRRRDKGHAAELRAFVEACRTGQQPWPASEMAAVTRATFGMRDAILSGAP
jgi:predicted dehydrogenase/threonine dehydrogenase-like Zn-dependent dehydrogenase